MTSIVAGITKVFVGRSEERMYARIAEELHSGSANRFAGFVGQGVLVQMLDYPVGISSSPIVTDHEIIKVSDLCAIDFID